MATKFKLPYQDYSEEISTTRFNVVSTITDLQFTDVFNAVTGVTLDGDQRSALVVDTPKDGTNSGPATNKSAQRENKWLVSYIDPTNDGKAGKFEIPCADLSLLTANTDKMDLTAGAGLTLKTQLELYARSPADNAITVVSVRFVGRKL